MNICMLTSEFPPDLGGISFYLHNLSKRLLPRGHSVTVITRGNKKKTFFNYIDGIKVYYVRFFPCFPDPFKFHQININSLLRDIENEFDLLHLHGSLIPSVTTNLPIVFTSHGILKKDIDNMPIKSLHFFAIKLIKKTLINGEMKLMKNSDALTAVSKSNADEIREYFKINRSIEIINPGVDTDFFHPNGYNKSEQYILTTCRLETRKGIFDIIETAKTVCNAYHDTKFVLTGKGSIKKILEKEISSYELGNNFWFPGFVTREKLLELYQNSMIYLLPSYYEGMPSSLLEAMSCGLPAIATNVEGNSELIIDGKNGVLIPPRDPERISEAIFDLIENPTKRSHLGKNARKTVENNYGWNKVIDRFEEVYKSLLENN